MQSSGSTFLTATSAAYTTALPALAQEGVGTLVITNEDTDVGGWWTPDGGTTEVRIPAGPSALHLRITRAAGTAIGVKAESGGAFTKITAAWLP